MEVDSRAAGERSEHASETYYFCSPICKERFDADPHIFSRTGDGTHARANQPINDSAPLVSSNHHSGTTPDGADEQIDLAITGMTCAACARRIERKLARTPGVRRTVVNFATLRATIKYDPQATNARELIKVIKAVGYDTAGTARAEFIVDDSARPSGSSQPLERHVGALRGVVNASFNLATMEVKVEYLPGAINVRAIRRAIEEFGYRLREVAGENAAAEDSEAAARASEYKDLKHKFIVAAVLSLPVLIIAMSHGSLQILNFPGVNWLQLALSTPVVFYCGEQFYRGAWAAFRHRAADMNTLIAVGSGAPTSIQSPRRLRRAFLPAR
jgi:Cu+-exporting ATPase